MDHAAHIVLARLNSRRLPGKGLMDLGGKPLLHLTLERLRRCKTVTRIILATSNSDVDDPLEDFAKNEGIEVFRGDPDDVAGRCLACAKANRLDWFIRICGDSPFIDPAVVDQVANLYVDDGVEIATNVLKRSYPVGCSAEAVDTAALSRLCATTRDMRYLEHVTAFFYENPDIFMISSLEAPDDRYENVSIAVDTEQDYVRTKWVYDHLSDPVTAPLDEVVRVTQEWGGKELKKE
ncbi:MAG: NTP transferase domain-containing protein [Alphaproteobacteria bacterium]